MLELGHTNLERLQYLVFDEANILVEKFSQQINTFISCFYNLIKDTLAQLILVSHFWSNKLSVFLDAHMTSRVVVATNKLEASYFGHTQHAIYDESSRTKLENLLEILRKVSFETNLEDEPNNTVIFANKSESVMEIGRLLTSIHNYSNVNLVHRDVDPVKIKSVESKWRHFDALKPNTGLKACENNNLILIVEQHTIGQLSIDNAKCVVHYDAPASRRALADRLWFMHKHFAKSKAILFNPSVVETFDVEDALNVKLLGENELVRDDSDRILSFILISKSDKDFSTGLLNHFRRIGVEEKKIPKILYDMASKVGIP